MEEKKVTGIGLWCEECHAKNIDSKMDVKGATGGKDEEGRLLFLYQCKNCRNAHIGD